MRKIAVTALAVVLLAAPAAMAGVPVPGIGIVIKKNPGGGDKRAGVTARDGRFAFMGDGPGNYDITLSGARLAELCLPVARTLTPRGAPPTGPRVALWDGKARLAEASACSDPETPALRVDLTPAQAARRLIVEVTLVTADRVAPDGSVDRSLQGEASKGAKMQKRAPGGD